MARTRSGFTLIELMVAMALTLFVMVILSQAFIMSLDTFSNMKGLGDMQVNLRTAENLLRDDLSQFHFEGSRRLSDVSQPPAAPGPVAQIVAAPPQEGFFCVRQGSPLSGVVVGTWPYFAPYAFEGVDPAGLPSVRAYDQYLYFTVRKKGNRPESFFNTPLNGPSGVLGSFFSQSTAYNLLGGMLPSPPNAAPDLPIYTQTPPYVVGSGNGNYGSQWAEVLYYLVMTGTTESTSDPKSTDGTPIFSLYRAQFVMVPNATGVNTVYTNGNGYSGANILALSQTTFAGMSCNPGATSLVFNSPADAAKGSRVVPDIATFPNPGGLPDTLVTINGSPFKTRVFAGATLVMPNVISFNVQMMPLVGPGNTAFQDVALYDTTKFGVGAYATNGLKAIQITMRVFDTKTRQSRQATVMQDM